MNCPPTRGSWRGVETNGVNTARAIADNIVVSNDKTYGPHHPLVCQDDIGYHRDGRLTCPHTTIPSGNIKLQQCLDYTIAILILELANLDSFTCKPRKD